MGEQCVTVAGDSLKIPGWTILSAMGLSASAPTWGRGFLNFERFREPIREGKLASQLRLCSFKRNQYVESRVRLESG
jgi:hypothetical protein